MLSQKLNSWLSAILFLVFTAILGYTVEQGNFNYLLYGAWFLVYLWIIYGKKTNNEILFLLGIGIFARFVLFPAFPLLSDDIYRFIWDGRLIVNGQNPFDHLPTYWLTADGAIYDLNQELFTSLNSPEYFTIYPPICQAIFAASQWISGSSIFGAALVFKGFLIGFELGSLFFIYKILDHLKLPAKNLLFYALNPLIILEISGNLHFEGAMIFFLCWSFWLLLKKKWVLSAVVLSLSVASKLLPLMFLPFLINYLGWKKGIQYCIIVGLCAIVIFIPLLSPAFIQNFSTSLDLYFQKFEFNASIYYLGRAIGEWKKGYNIIATLGPALGLSTLVGILIIAWGKNIKTFYALFTGCLLGFVLYMFLGTTIHPWYLSIPILLSCFTTFRFPLLWSALIMMTYLNYGGSQYHEHLWIVFLEYVVVYTLFFYEVVLFYKGKKLNLEF